MNMVVPCTLHSFLLGIEFTRPYIAELYYIMELVKRDPLYVVVEAEEKELFHNIIEIERRIQDINSSIKGLIEHKIFLEHELQVKKRKQDDCRRKKEQSSKV